MKTVSMVLLCSLAAVSGLPDCQYSNFPTWKIIGSYCVYFFESRYNFSDAEGQCFMENHLSHLISVHSITEKNELQNLIGIGVTWTGLFRGPNGTLKWSDDTKFDIKLDVGGKSTDCCVKIDDKENWVCVDCDEKNRYVCAIPIRYTSTDKKEKED